jgi:hypothetical protein
VYQSHTGRPDWALVPAKPAQRLNTTNNNNIWHKAQKIKEKVIKTQTNKMHVGQIPIFTSYLSQYLVRYVTIKLARSFHIAANNAKGIAR